MEIATELNKCLCIYLDDCQWNAWEPWSPYCSKICGTDSKGSRGRIRTKQREETDVGACSGLPTEEQNCISTDPCIGINSKNVIALN